ncbi:hypothetical protein Tsubulata_030077 [Turnera subulata]|uniref:Uncharacterized protein n=1 Tax=Turnera subulata TaxID=218843 RepID=A0A9Q0FQE5_9ROSI|nr:hypothetical protein Tsubulata_030077 [Turnera subulata]
MDRSPSKMNHVQVPPKNTRGVVRVCLVPVSQPCPPQPTTNSRKEHPTESEKPHSEDKDDSDKKPHFEADSNIDENEDEDEEEGEDDSHNRNREKLHYEDDSDIDEVEPMLKTYNQQVKESEGYDVTCFLTKVAMFGPFIPVEKDENDTLHLDLTYECVDYAIKLYNEQKILDNSCISFSAGPVLV